MLHHQDFIKADYPFHREYTGKNIAPLFRKKFILSAPGKARLYQCGMVGIRRLLLALNKCGLYDLAYQMLTADGYPGYKGWFDQGAATLWEVWPKENLESKNHHMLSDFMSWIIKTLVGIRVDHEKLGSAALCFDPHFVAGIDYVKGAYATEQGDIEVFWERKEGKVCLSVKKPEKLSLRYGEIFLKDGMNQFVIE